MSSVPTDSDEDDIKHILESIWEMTSGENDSAKRPDRPRPIQLKRTPASADADADTGIRGLEDLPAIRSGTSAKSPLQEAKRTRLADRLETDRHNPLPETQLSSLTRPGDAHAMSASQNNSHNGSRHQCEAPENKRGIVLPNPYAEREAGHAQQSSAPEAALNGSSANTTTMSGSPKVAPANPQTSQPASSSGAEESQDVKRVMVPFADSSMCKMANVSKPAPRKTVAQPPPAAAAPVAAKAPQTDETTQHHIDTSTAPEAAPHASSSHDAAAEMMRPVLRQWLGENMPRIVETALQIEASQSLNPDAGESEKKD